MKRMMRIAVPTMFIALMATLSATPASAARGGKHVPPSTTGSCSVTPNPNTVGGQYTVVGSGFKTGELINVYVTDSHVMGAFMLMADASGSISVSSYSSWAGASTVTVYDNGGRKMIFLTSCTFDVK